LCLASDDPANPVANTAGIGDSQSSSSPVARTGELEKADPTWPTKSCDRAIDGIDPLGLLQGNNDADNVGLVTP
jgi:hypothetical protein